MTRFRCEHDNWNRPESEEEFPGPYFEVPDNPPLVRGESIIYCPHNWQPYLFRGHTHGYEHEDGERYRIQEEGVYYVWDGEDEYRLYLKCGRCQYVNNMLSEAVEDSYLAVPEGDIYQGPCAKCHLHLTVEVSKVP